MSFFGSIADVFKDVAKPVENILPYAADAAAIATGNPELLPLTQGLGTATSDILKGKNVGKSLLQGAEQGALTFAGQEALGALGGAFPETFGAIGSGISDALSGAGSAADSVLSGAGITSEPVFSGSGGSFFGGSGVGNLVGSEGSDFLTSGGGTGTTTPNLSLDSSGIDNLAKSYSDVSGGGLTGENTFSKLLSDPSLSNLSSFAKNNGWIAPAAGLVGNAILSQKKLPGQQQISDIAASTKAQADQLESYFNNGTLPPGVQASINQSAEANKASIRSKYAQMGMSGSSAEAQDLQSANQQAQIAGTNYSIHLLETGIKESGSAANLYTQIMQDSLQQDKELGAALSNFGMAFGTGSSKQQAQTGA